MSASETFHNSEKRRRPVVPKVPYARPIGAVPLRLRDPAGGPSKRPLTLAGWTVPGFVSPPIEEGDNVGMRLDSVTVWDCDGPEAVAYWEKHGDPTPYISESRPGHRAYWYRDEAIAPGYYRWATVSDGPMMGEIRAGHKVQCVIPPSTHPETGTAYKWVGDGGEPDWATFDGPPLLNLPPAAKKQKVNAPDGWKKVYPNSPDIEAWIKDGWCPARSDHSAEGLVLGELPDGRYMPYCHGGCERDAVIAALVAEGRYDREQLYPPDRSLAGALPESFWSARPEFGHIRQAAWSRKLSGEAVLHAYLTRRAAAVPHNVLIPAIVGKISNLGYFAALLGPSGAGKSAAYEAACDLHPVDEKVRELPNGTGEGVLEAMFEYEKDPSDGRKKAQKVKRWSNAHIYIDEGESLFAAKTRTGATIMPTIRTIWTGGLVGQANANQENSRVLPARSYVYGMCIGIQSEKAGAILDDSAGGTPQRFGWARYSDKKAPLKRPVWPGELKPRGLGGAIAPKAYWTQVPGAKTYAPPPTYMTVDSEIESEIEMKRHLILTEEVLPDAHDSHRELYRLKVAGLLAIIDGRLNISTEDWQLAGMVREASESIRDTHIELAEVEKRAIYKASTERAKERAIAVAEGVSVAETLRCAKTIAGRVRRENPNGWTVSTLRKTLSTPQKAVYPEALDLAKSEGWAIEQIDHGQGGERRSLVPGPKEPK